MLKNKDYHIKISGDKLNLMKQIAIKDKIRLSQVFERAVDCYLRAKKVLPLVCMTKKG